MIWIDISFVNNNKTGIGAYTNMIIDILKNKQLPYKCLQLNLPEEIKWKSVWQILWLNSIVYLKTLIKTPQYFISPAFIIPNLTYPKTKYIVTIHDLCSLRKNEMTKLFSLINRLSINNSVKKADKIITVSNTIKQELIEKFNINPDRVKVVYNSVPEHFFNAEINSNVLDKYKIQQNKYILSVATLNKRKNIPELIKAFEYISDKYPDLKLVLVGGMGNENREKLTKHPNIIFTGYIPDEDVPTLYKNALLYMYPSLYEGFGIPLIEAQYCGCPVLCSDIPVFREIGANSVEYCKPNSKDIATGLEKLINNPDRLRELSGLGKNNIKRFDKEIITKQILEMING